MTPSCSRRLICEIGSLNGYISTKLRNVLIGLTAFGVGILLDLHLSFFKIKAVSGLIRLQLKRPLLDIKVAVLNLKYWIIRSIWRRRSDCRHDLIEIGRAHV